MNHPVRRGVRDPEQRSDLAHGQVRPPVDRDQQHPIGPRQRPLPTRPAIRDLVATALGHQPYELALLTRLQPGEPTDPLRPGRCDHLHHNTGVM